MKKVLVKIWLKITPRAEILHFRLHFPTVDNHQEENHFLISQKTFPDCNFKLLQMVLVACSELEIIGYYDLKLLQHKCKEIPQDMKQAEMGDVTTCRQFH